MFLLVREAEYPSYRALVRHSLGSNVDTSTSLDKEAENQVSLPVTSLPFFPLKNKTETNKPSSPLSSTCSKIRAAQRLAWLLSKEDTDVCDVFRRWLRGAGKGRAHQRLFSTSWLSPTT